jgi:hypothetical protein
MRRALLSGTGGLVALILLLLRPSAASAQAHCEAGSDTSAAALAARYAPVLRFAPSEPYFPTVPFFSAFDGIDNDGNGRTDFQDPDEIAQFNKGDTLHTSWATLDSLYVQEKKRTSPAELTQGPPVAPVPAVFYRVATLTTQQQDAMRRYLKKDILVWDKTRRTRLGSSGILQHPFKVIEYYFYYVRDVGLVGHPQDIEFVFVFVPADPALACEARMLVGAGHTERVPNNTLVLTNNTVLGSEDLARFDTLTSVITELGGHSSAPDVPPYGKFMLGVDVNIQPTKAWGVRDVQALAQMGYGGAYQPTMTLSRDTVFHPVYYWPRGATYSYGQDYSLLPAPLFARLYGVLDTVATGVAPGQWPATVATVRGLLDSIAVLMNRPPFAGTDSLDSLTVKRMAAWTRPMMAPPGREGGEIAPHRGQPWEHSIYNGSPDVIFKSHLYPPSMRSVEKPVDLFRLITWGVTEWPGNSHQFQVGFVIPWPYLPFEPRGFMTLEAGLIASDDFSGREFGLDFSYYSEYFQRVNWYTTTSYIPESSITGSHFTVSVGPSLLLWMKSNKKLFQPINVLRFSTGPRFRLSGSSSTSGVDWEFKFSFRQ